MQKPLRMIPLEKVPRSLLARLRFSVHCRKTAQEAFSYQYTRKHGKHDSFVLRALRKAGLPLRGFVYWG